MHGQPVGAIFQRIILGDGRARQFAVLADQQQTATKLADRKTIDRAKGILMKQRGLDEDAAYQSLRKLAMQRGMRMGEIAKQVIQAAELLS